MRHLIFLLALLTPAFGWASEAFPRPASLDPAVSFWKRVFAEAPTHGGFLHDPENLAVVYERLDLPADRRAADRQINARKTHYAATLRALASHPDAPQGATQKRLRALWPDAGPVALREAAARIRFQRGQSDKFHAGLYRSGRWETFIRDTFAARGMPLELAALPHVESSFNPVAGSHVGARGLWQFMPDTGRRFMRVDHVLDERLDPYRATEAAAGLLAYNYERVGAWPLAITAYNHGLGGVQRAVRTTGTTNIGTIIQTYRGPLFGFASRNFYPSFLAVLSLSSESTAPREAPEVRNLATLPAYVDPRTLAAQCDVPLEVLRAHNPAVLAGVWSGSKRLPRGYALSLPAGASAGRFIEVATAHGFGDQRADLTHRVARGETLSHIARRHGTTVAALMSANGLRSASRVRAGAVLRLPGRAPAPETRLASVKADSVPVPRLAPVAAPVVVAAAKPGPAVEVRAAAAAAPATTAAVPAQDAVPVIQPDAEVLAASVLPLNLGGDDEQTPSATLGRATEAQLGVRADGRLVVQPGESLGLLSQWTGVPVTQLRAHAGLKARQSVRIGQTLRVPVTRVNARELEARRRAHHTALRTQFLERHTIAGVHTHRVRKGESLWTLAARKYSVPLWLALAYNPDLDPAGLKPGVTVRFPRLKPRA